MEEARVYFLDKINLPFTKMEEANIFSPVVSFTCNYHFPVWFDDEFEIKEERGLELNEPANENFDELDNARENFDRVSRGPRPYFGRSSSRSRYSR
ncbi:MAG: hypothetical protein II870_00660 [Synergistaceae bacterium]|nr:hypothetical protein [Synergistaceae bacterium]